MWSPTSTNFLANLSGPRHVGSVTCEASSTMQTSNFRLAKIALYAWKEAVSNHSACMTFADFGTNSLIPKHVVATICGFIKRASMSDSDVA